MKKEKRKTIVKTAEWISGITGYIILSYIDWRLAFAAVLLNVAHLLRRHSRV